MEGIGPAVRVALAAAAAGIPADTREAAGAATGDGEWWEHEVHPG